MVIPEAAFWEMIVDQPTDLLYEFINAYGQSLSEKESKWLIEACVNGLSIKEIAESEHVSVSTVKKWRSAARNKPREQLAINPGN